MDKFNQKDKVYGYFIFKIFMLGQIRNFENYPTFSAIDIFYSHVILFFE